MTITGVELTGEMPGSLVPRHRRRRKQDDVVQRCKEKSCRAPLVRIDDKGFFRFTRQAAGFGAGFAKDGQLVLLCSCGKCRQDNVVAFPVRLQFNADQIAAGPPMTDEEFQSAQEHPVVDLSPVMSLVSEL